MISGARVCMWLNYRQSGNGQNTIAVPAPVDAATPDAPWWYDRICQLAPELAAIGITDVLFPNPVIGQGAPGSGDDGYNPFDDYDIGGKGTPTRFGAREQFQRAVAVCHANGLNVLLDHVMHQRMGGANGVYRYRSATGASNGRFAKDPPCFRGAPPRVPEDPVPDVPDDYAFGDELCPVNGQPPRYVWNGLLDAADWLFRGSGADGGRLDDMKGIAIAFMNAFFAAPFAQGKFWFGEYASGNRDDTDWWVGQVGERASATDFDFHYNMVQPMCMNAGAGNWQMAWMTGRGMIGSNPLKAVPFVESMDSDTDGFATIVFNKLLGYALMLGGEGLPIVYIKDYLADPGCYGLKPWIDNLVWVHQMLANGPTDVVHADAKSYVFRRTGEPGLLVALNNDVWNPGWTTVRVWSGFSPGTVLHDYTGKNGQDCAVDEQGYVTFGIPPAANGMGFGCWAPNWLGGSIAVKPRATTQTIFGAPDLDVPAATNGRITVSPRFYIAKGSPIGIAFSAKTAGWSEASSVTVQLIGPSGAPAGGTAQGVSGPATVAHSAAAETGWHTLVLTGAGLPAAGSSFEASVTYSAPQEI